MNLSDRFHWIFDMDGTLTVAIHDFDAIRESLGLRRGRPILEQLAEMPPSQSGPIFKRLDEIELELVRRVKPQTGARDLLVALRDRGASLGVLTRNSHENALGTLEVCGLSEFFKPENVLGRESCKVKPSADGILLLLAAWAAPRDKAVMVGDYLFDLVAGREAGTATVYLDPSGRFEYADHADVCVKDLEQLAGLLDGGID
jgi:phosphoglycolate phosphatase-like HAD superfamily hydrolase